MRGWYRRWRTLIGEMWRFSVVGIANIGVNFVVFNLLVLLLFTGSELKANVVATVIATTSSYLMNRGWTFRHRRTSRIPREYVLFFVFNGLALGIELAVMGAAKYGFGLTALWALNLAKVLGLGLGTVFRFWTYRTFVFHGASSRRTADTTPAQEPTADQHEPAAHEPAAHEHESTAHEVAAPQVAAPRTVGADGAAIAPACPPTEGPRA